MPGNKTNYASSSSNDTVYSARKNTTGTIAKGEPVYAVGYHADGYYLVEKAKADAAATMPSIGLAETPFSDSETGSVMVSGVLREMNTSAWSVADELFVSAATAGVLTNTKPAGITDVVEKVGVVVSSHATAGVIQVYNAGAAVHANRSGGLLHTVASDTEAGFQPQSKLDATAAPGINDDVSQGYQIGSRWADVSADKEYVCLDATDGAAVWKKTTGQKTDIVHLNALQAAAASWTSVGAWIFPGTVEMGSPSNIKVVMQHNTTEADVRVYDVTNSLVIATALDIATALAIRDLGTLSNLPTGEAIWELQIQETGAGYFDIFSLSVYY